MSKNKTSRLIHGYIDPYAPGGFEALLAHHRATFGDAVMQDPASSGSGPGSGGDGGAGNTGGTGGTGGAGAGTEGAAGTNGGSGDGGSGEGTGADEFDGEGGPKALKAERQVAKQLKADLAARDARIKELEDAGKTDEQKREQTFKDLQASDAEKTRQLEQKDTTILQYRVAAAKGLDLEAAERLRGATKEELESDADQWIAKWGGSAGNGVVPGAGAAGSSGAEVAPGMSRLRHAYGEAGKK
ncbi:hypothetical protein [Arthrobacter sp. JSM 101049]|uniref:hypothetical protein n=1 Tax=Arthrobacter sp. JSM 101049 TaxID=929097 RepID=UPI0035688541